jgi:hypothetical protein
MGTGDRLFLSSSSDEVAAEPCPTVHLRRKKKNGQVM